MPQVLVNRVKHLNLSLQSLEDVRPPKIKSIQIFLNQYISVAPKIDRRNLVSLTVKEGEPIYIDVKVSGEPAPDVTWYQDNKTITSTSHKRVDNVPYNSKFFNDKPERKDTGVYKIVAVNKYGQDQAEIDITVVCKY